MAAQQFAQYNVVPPISFSACSINMDARSMTDLNMTSGNVSPTVTRPGKPRKLRQTCDACAEAKVKCDKGNPRCGRCDRLSYDCVYSPARRIGRPHPRHHKSLNRGHVTQEEPRCNDKAHTTARRDEVRPEPPPDYGEDFNEALPDYFPGTARQSTFLTQLSSNGSRTEDCTANIDGVNQAWSAIDNIEHRSEQYDCATTAVATLRRLTAAGRGSQRERSEEAANALAEQISDACREAARILVCPCSEEIDMALLAASLTSAILEVANIALHALKPAMQQSGNEKRTVQALGTLSRISRVVTLFTHRYSATQANRPPEALPLLATSLKSTLKTLAEDTTNRFLDTTMPVSAS